MTVLELIKELKKKCRADQPVMIAYDSFVCISTLEPEQIAVSKSGVYLCADSASYDGDYQESLDEWETELG